MTLCLTAAGSGSQPGPGAYEQPDPAAVLGAAPAFTMTGRPTTACPELAAAGTLSTRSLVTKAHGKGLVMLSNLLFHSSPLEMNALIWLTLYLRSTGL